MQINTFLKTSYLITLLLWGQALHAVTGLPDWRQLQWESSQWVRDSLIKETSLYQLPTPGDEIALSLYFSTGVYSFLKEKRNEVEAAASLLLFTKKANIDLFKLDFKATSQISPTGRFYISLKGPRKNLSKAIEILSRFHKSPKVTQKNFQTWKKFYKNNFLENYSRFNAKAVQTLMHRELLEILHGKDHPRTQFLESLSPRQLAAYDKDQLQSYFPSLLNRTLLDIYVNKSLNKKEKGLLKDFVNLLPRRRPSVYRWYPKRSLRFTSQNIKAYVTLIHDSSLKEAHYSFKVSFPHLHQLNPREKLHITLAREIMTPFEKPKLGLISQGLIRNKISLARAPYLYWQDDTLPPNKGGLEWTLQYAIQKNSDHKVALDFSLKILDEVFSRGMRRNELIQARKRLMSAVISGKREMTTRSLYAMEQLIRGNLPREASEEGALLRMEQENRVKDLNRTLKQIDSSQSVIAVVIAAPFPKGAGKEIQDLKHIQMVKRTTFKEILQDLL